MESVNRSSCVQIQKILREFASVLRRRDMDKSTLEKQATEAEAQAAKYTRLAKDLREALARFDNGASAKPIKSPSGRGKHKSAGAGTKSALAAALDVLAEHRKPMHINDLVAAVSRMRAMATLRSSLESVLATAVKDSKYGLRRPARGTYELVK